MQSTALVDGAPAPVAGLSRSPTPCSKRLRYAAASGTVEAIDGEWLGGADGIDRADASESFPG